MQSLPARQMVSDENKHPENNRQSEVNKYVSKYL